MIKRAIYHGGHMLSLGSQMQREYEKKSMEDAGLTVYSPKDDPEINDKQNQTEESNSGLAEKIVRNDTIAMKKADTVVIEPLHEAIGTLCELGTFYGYNEYRQHVADIIYNSEIDSDKKIDELIHLVEDVIPHKEIYAHYGDIRRTDIPEVGDRRSWSINQYLYGVVLKLTNGRGFMDFKDIVEELKNKYRK